jgi:hypothetical protein
MDASAVQRRVTGTCPGGSAVRTIFSDGTVACETDDVGLGAVQTVSAGVGMAVSGGASAIVDVFTGPGLVGLPDAIALDFSGSDGADQFAARADHVHTAYVPASGAKSCAAGTQMFEIDPSGTVFCGPDEGGGYGVGPSGNLQLVGNDFRLAGIVNVASITAGSYRLPAPTPRFYTVHNSEFDIKQSGPQGPIGGAEYFSTGQYGLIDYPGGSSTEQELLAPLNLPHGALIDQIEVIYANGSFGAIDCGLHFIELATLAVSTFPLGAVPTGVAGVPAVHVAAIAPPAIDNSTHAHVMECYLYEEFDSAETWLYGIRIRYLLQELVR